MHGLMSETKKQESEAAIMTDSTSVEGMLGCFPFIRRATLICELSRVSKTLKEPLILGFLWDAIILLEVMGVKLETLLSRSGLVTHTQGLS